VFSNSIEPSGDQLTADTPQPAAKQADAESAEDAMTDNELIDWAEAQMGIGLTHGEQALVKRLISLARVGAARQPPEGAAKLKIAVAYDQPGNILMSVSCGDYEYPEDALREAEAHIDATHSGIVTFFLPRKQTPEVEGTSARMPIRAGRWSDDGR